MACAEAGKVYYVGVSDSSSLCVYSSDAVGMG